MRKKFKKRLLGIILTILMVVSVIPVQQVQPVKAAEITKDTWIYLDVSKNTNWTQDDAVFGFVSTKNNKNSERVLMEKISGTDIWKGQLQADATNIQFLRLNSKDKNGTPWNTSSGWPALEDGKNMFVLTAPEWNATGTWSTYSEGGDTPKTTGTYYVNTTLVDYFNNARVNNPNDTFNNEGNETGSGKAPYSQLNQWLSKLDGYALNEVTSKEDPNAPVPLYFGDLFHESQGGGDLNWYWQGANVAFDSNDDKNSCVAQGIVEDHLDAKGNLITSYTYNDKSVKVPFFNENAYPLDQNKYMQFYNNLKFPFKKETNAKGASTYSFNSDKNTVYYDYTNKKIVSNDGEAIKDVNGATGYFPFNKTNPTNKGELNYGFGTQFTIPFTVTETGKNVDNTDMKFSFTGDDDVWVYIDGALVLDMGGAHNKAKGEIDFANQTATITTGTSNARLGNQPKAGGRTSAVYNNSTVNFSDITVIKSDKTQVKLDEYMKQSGTVHELKMYYMERGMWSSNMSISYSFVPLPSGLSVSKQVDTTNVNEGLKTAAANKDTFNFTMKKGNTKTNLTNVSGVSYSLYDGTTTHSAKVGTNGMIALKDKQYASSFENANESDAFKPGEYFNITEATNENYTTRWYVTDLDKIEEQKKPVAKGDDSNVAEFQFGKNDNEFSKANYNVNFVNTPKTGTLTLTKNYIGTAPEGARFGFKVSVDLNGGDNYSDYDLEYTSSKNQSVTETATGGRLELTADETVTFTGIPAGATYQIKEDVPKEGDTWVKDIESNLTGTIEANKTKEASVTNKTHSEEINKVIYVEAGDGKYTKYQPKEVTSDYVVKDLSYGLNYDSTTKEFNVKTPNEKYTASYTGKNKKGDVSGTITVYSYAVSNDVYVFDYGLKSDLADTSHGAGMFQNDNLFNKNVPDGTAKFTKLTTDKLTQSTITGPTDTALTQLKDDEENKLPGAKLSEGTVEFNPTAFMDKQETASYETTVLGKDKTKVETAEDGVVMSADVTVMPANVVYYEDNFNAGSTNTDGTAKIVYSGTTSTEGTSVELTQSNGQTEQYGHDDAYAKGTGDSAGSSTVMTSTTDPNTNKYTTKATFKFKGTGFDVVGRTSTETTTVSYRVKDSSGKVESMGVVDTFYANGNLYQIPVIHVEGLAYTEHTVELVIGESSVSGNEKRNVFYLDGIRIYNPMGEKGDNDYIDNEENVNITKVSDLILGDGKITEKGVTNRDDVLLTDIDIPGSKAAIMSYYGSDSKLEALGVNVTEGIVDGAATPTDSVIEYLHSGPNNEVYLGSGSALGMVVKATGDTDTARTLQIEAKAVKAGIIGESAVSSMNLNYLTLNETIGAIEEKTADTVKTATAMYYKIPVEDTISLGKGYYLVAVLGADSEDGSHVLSFTNVKSKGYEIYNALRATSTEKEDEEMAALRTELERYIKFDLNGTEQTPYFADFKLTGKPAIRRGTWIRYDVTVSKDMVNAAKKDANGNPELVLYFNNKGTLTPVTAYVEFAKKNKDDNYVYQIRFKTPNSRGSFALQLYYKDAKTGEQSAEFINAELKVAR